MWESRKKPDGENVKILQTHGHLQGRKKSKEKKKPLAAE